MTLSCLGAVWRAGCVLGEGAGLLVFTQRGQLDGEVVGRGEGVGVVFAQDPAAAGEGVLGEGAGLLVFTQRGQPDGEVVGRAEGVGVGVAELGLVEGVGPTGEREGELRSTPCLTPPVPPARDTADSAAATNDRPAGNRRNSDVCDKNTRRGGGRSPDMTHSIPVLIRRRQDATPSNRQASTPRRARPGRLRRR